MLRLVEAHLLDAFGDLAPLWAGKGHEGERESKPEGGGTERVRLPGRRMGERADVFIPAP